MIIITNHHHYHTDTGGLCVAGLHMVGQMRRATGEAASSMYDQLTDTVTDRWAVTYYIKMTLPPKSILCLL